MFRNTFLLEHENFFPFDLLLVNDGAYHFNLLSHLYSNSIQQFWSTKKIKFHFIPFFIIIIASKTFFFLYSAHKKIFCRDNFIDPPSPSLSFHFHTQWDDLWWPFLLFLLLVSLTRYAFLYCLMLKWPFYLMNYDRWPPTSNIFRTYRLLYAVCIYLYEKLNELHAMLLRCRNLIEIKRSKLIFLIILIFWCWAAYFLYSQFPFLMKENNFYECTKKTARELRKH